MSKRTENTKAKVRFGCLEAFELSSLILGAILSRVPARFISGLSILSRRAPILLPALRFFLLNNIMVHND